MKNRNFCILIGCLWLVSSGLALWEYRSVWVALPLFLAAVIFLSRAVWLHLLGKNNPKSRSKSLHQKIPCSTLEHGIFQFVRVFLRLQLICGSLPP